MIDFSVKKVNGEVVKSFVAVGNNEAKDRFYNEDVASGINETLILINNETEKVVATEDGSAFAMFV